MSGIREETEEALVARARTGDREAFGLLVHAYLPRLYRVAYGVVRNGEEAADIAQDAFVRAYRAIRRFDPSRPVFPWLYQITRNLALNRIARVRNREGTLEIDSLVAPGKGPEDAVEADDECARIRRAVARLPEQHRLVIELNHFQECSYRDMAEILGIPVGTVMSRLYHARKRLRTVLEEEEHGEPVR